MSATYSPLSLEFCLVAISSLESSNHGFLGQLFPSLFGMFLIIIFSMYLRPFAQTISEPKIFHKASLRIRNLSLETRHWLAQAFKWTALCFFLVLLVLMFFVMLETGSNAHYSCFFRFFGSLAYMLAVSFFDADELLCNRLTGESTTLRNS